MIGHMIVKLYGAIMEVELNDYMETFGIEHSHLVGKNTNQHLKEKSN